MSVGNSVSGFINRQVRSYSERFENLTVPELRKVAKKHGLATQGKKQQLLMRLALWVRDEMVEANPSIKEEEATLEENAVENADDWQDQTEDSDNDESSVGSEELEICGGESRPTREAAKSIPPNSNEGTLQGKLYDIFGFKEFRQGQEWAINRCLSKKRSLLVAPTGFGKSLCYALPAAIMEGVCVVISPLVSLIEVRMSCWVGQANATN